MKNLPDTFYPPLEKYSKYLIYGLVDPRDNNIKYVGKSSNGFSRIRQHFVPSQLKYTNLKSNWLKSLLKVGLFPIPIVLEQTNERGFLCSLEIEHIAKLKASGIKLLNMTKGGDGDSYHRSPNRVPWNKGRKTPPSTKLAQRNAKLGKKFKPRKEETKQKIVKANIQAHKHESKPFMCIENKKIYASQGEAAKELGITPGNISGVLNGHKKTTKGYSFKYV